MDHLWAPWRLAYVAAPKPKSEPNPLPGGSCFICSGQHAGDDRANLLVDQTERSVVYLNRFPYNNGHLLICPRRHEGRLEALNTHELLDLQLLLQKMINIFQKKIHPDGFNIGLNLGKAAGAGVPGHLHWHIVPRWNGDTNFMPVTGDTRVIVQSLEALYDLMKEELAT